MNTELPITLYGVIAAKRDPSGCWTVALDQPNELPTACGMLTPRYSPPDHRRRARHPLAIYADGTPKRISLESRAVVSTPIGDFPAEAVTFHPNGALKRVFPLDGQVTGFWSEQEEGVLQQPLEVPLPWGSLRARLISLCFYPSGALRSVTLWPGERVTVPAPAGEIVTGIGFSLYEDGKLESIEPAQPEPVATPMGTLPAYDALAVGVQADRCSLQFESDGRVRGLALSGVGIHVQYEDGRVARVYPRPTANLAPGEDGEEAEPLLLPIRVDIREDAVVVRSGDATALFPAFHTRFTVEGECATGGCGSCAGCAGCSGCR